MADDEWRVSDLLDESQSVVADAKLAKQVVEVLANLGKTDLEVRVPKAAMEFAENALSDWFEVVADIEKRRGNIPYLIPRELYPAGSEGAPEWDQGLRLEDWKQWLSDPHFMEKFDQLYHQVKMHKNVRENGPLSGYYNRIFPVKFVLRVLAALSLIGTHEISTGDLIWDDNEEQIPLEKLRSNALQHALYAREYLTGLDKPNKLKNTGSEIAVGFPESSEKAKERFVAQFVGSKRKKQLSGALIDMGFANLPKFLTFAMDEVHFTPAGWQFMMLPNPLMDTGLEGWLEYAKTGKRFSEQEIAFLLGHFKQNLPNEWEHVKNIAKAISNGKNRPKMLDQQLMEIYDWESSNASQMRNGAVSRMEELTLLTREKQGREVTYLLTKLGRKLLH